MPTTPARPAPTIAVGMDAPADDEEDEPEEPLEDEPDEEPEPDEAELLEPEPVDVADAAAELMEEFWAETPERIDDRAALMAEELYIAPVAV